MSESSQTSDSRGNMSRWARVAFLIALALTLAMLVMGITGTPWPRWLLAATNIL